MRGERHRSGGQALAGALLLTIGALLFATNLNLLNARQYWRYWPVAPLIVGLQKLLTGQSRGDQSFGIFLTILGGSQLARVLGYWSPGPADVAAVTLIGVGIFFIGRGLLGRAEPDVRQDASDWISAFALMAGFERSNNSKNFRGGDLTAIMGGCEIDLRQASLRAPASIDVFVMWGGVELRVPDDWTVDLQGTPLLAGFVDKTRPPSVATEKRLVIRGVALMGGVEIRTDAVHPLLGRIVGLTVYLGLWLVLGLAAALALAVRGGWPWVAALTGALPLALAYGVVCLAAWYVCRAFPLQGAGSLGRVTLAQGAAASITSAAWVGFGQWWLRAQIPAQPFWSRDGTLLLFAVGVLLFLFSAAVHYVFLALEAQDAARRQALESAVLAREAELRALRAQVNPHFLFNSLHSIGSLAGTRPAAARDMSIALGEFLRQSLRLGGLAGVPLQQEVDLMAQYLAIEQVRFGDRLQVQIDVEPAAGTSLVPPLLLQPLVENAIKHGVAGLLEGGRVSIVARRQPGRCVVTVENLFDPDSAPRAGTGTGVRNVRDRLATHFGVGASFEARAEGDRFTVTLAYPCDEAAGAARGATRMTGRTLKVLVVDDEALAREVAVEYLSGCQDVEVAGQCANGYEAVQAVSDAMPDVLLLDVQMPKLSGFDVLELIGPGPAVIFATAHDEFALKAFEVHAVDYLLKPFSQARLADAMARARQRLAAHDASPADQLRAALRAVRLERILVRDGGKVFIVPVDSLEYAQAQDDYVLLHAQGRNLLKEQAISSLEIQLDPARFVRIHRSWLISLARLARVELEGKDRRVAVLHDGTRLPISRAGYQRLQDALGRV